MSDFSQKVVAFSEILHKFNKVHSLTNYKDIQAQVKDSIKPLEFLNLEPKTAIDVGSGAGFPAIFLALKLDTCQWHLYEPNIKKASFLNYVKVELGIKNMTIHSQKIELCDKFIVDLITSRALTNISDLVKICSGFYDKKTKFLLYKGSSVDAEIGEFNAKIFNDKNRNYVLMDNIC